MMEKRVFIDTKKKMIYIQVPSNVKLKSDVFLKIYSKKIKLFKNKEKYDVYTIKCSNLSEAFNLQESLLNSL